MKDLRQFNIQFVGLKEGEHKYEYSIDKEFFELFNYDEFLSSEVKIDLSLVKKTTLLELTFSSSGYVELPCDITNELYHQEINSDLQLIVKFGPEYNDDNEEILILPHESYEFSVAQYIYEMIVLGIPNKRLHPKVIDGTMKSDVLEKLKELEVKEEKKEDNIDPRWDKLKNLIIEKKT